MYKYMTYLIHKQISQKVILFIFFFTKGHYSFYERAGRAQCPSETVWGKLCICLWIPYIINVYHKNIKLYNIVKLKFDANNSF